MSRISINWRKALSCCAAILCLATSVHARETVKVGFVGPLTGGVSAIGVGRAQLRRVGRQATQRRPRPQIRLPLLYRTMTNASPTSAFRWLPSWPRIARCCGSRNPLLLCRGPGHGGYLSPLSYARGGLGRSASRHYLRQRLQGNFPHARHHDQPEPGGAVYRPGQNLCNHP